MWIRGAQKSTDLGPTNALPDTPKTNPDKQKANPGAPKNKSARNNSLVFIVSKDVQKLSSVDSKLFMFNQLWSKMIEFANFKRCKTEDICQLGPRAQQWFLSYPKKQLFANITSHGQNLYMSRDFRSFQGCPAPRHQRLDFTKSYKNIRGATSFFNPIACSRIIQPATTTLFSAFRRMLKTESHALKIL